MNNRVEKKKWGKLKKIPESVGRLSGILWYQINFSEVRSSELFISRSSARVSRILFSISRVLTSIVNLRIYAFIFPEKTIVVFQIDMKRRQIILEESKTADEEPEYIPIDNTLHQTLLELGPKKTGPVFINREGRQFKCIKTPFHTALEKSGIKEARRLAGKPAVNVHSLRHTATSLLCMQGQPLQATAPP